MITSTLLSPDKDYKYGQQAFTERDFSQVNCSPIRDKPERSRNSKPNLKESQSTATLSIHQLQKARIPERK